MPRKRKSQHDAEDDESLMEGDSSDLDLYQVCRSAASKTRWWCERF